MTEPTEIINEVGDIVYYGNLAKEVFDAVERCDFDEVRRLIQNGADPNSKRKNKYKSNIFSLLSACNFNSLNFEITRFLIESGASIENAKFRYESFVERLTENDSYFEMLKMFVEEYNVDVNCVSKFHYHYTPLHSAMSGAINRDSKIVNFLLERGANVNAKDKIGRTPLCLALLRGRIDVANLLIEHGAEMNAQECYKNGANLLYYASMGGCINFVKLLLEQGAEVNVMERNGLDEPNTPLFWAARMGYVEIAKLLIEHGAEVNVQNKGRSPLRSASTWNRVEIVKLLLEHGAEVNIEDEDKWTPLHCAATRNHIEVVKLLLEHGANVNAQNKYGNTVFHLISKHNYPEIAKLLIEHGADVNIKSNSGKSALDSIKRNKNYYDVLKMLNDADIFRQDGDDEFTEEYIKAFI